MEKAVQTRPRESHLWQTSLWLPPGGRTKQNNNDLQLQIPQLWYTIGDKQFIWLSPVDGIKKKSRFTAENSEPVVNFGTNLTLTWAQSTDKKNSIFTAEHLGPVWLDYTHENLRPKIRTLELRWRPNVPSSDYKRPAMDWKKTQNLLKVPTLNIKISKIKTWG